MKKILIVISIMIGGYTNAFAQETYTFKAGTDNTCYINAVDHTGNIVGAVFTLGISAIIRAASGGWIGDEFWFCGKQDAECSGNRYDGTDTAHWLYNGDSFVHNNVKYFCCAGSVSGKGYFAEANKWQTTRTETKNLENGTCKYVVTKDACGNETRGDCDTPSTCATGYYIRNNECIRPCTDDGMAFESNTSNKCISCPTTSYSGIDNKTNPTAPVCRKCDPVVSLWDAYEKKCVSKASLTALSTTELEYGIGSYTQTKELVTEKCWTKYNKEYSDCVLNSSKKRTY